MDCIKDYGSVYGFWLFSFERYNGTLGNFHNNKKDITAQLMRQFIQCYQLVTPIMFKEELQPLLPVQKNVSEVHSSSSDFKFVGLPTLSKFSSLDPSDYSLLGAMYSHLYNCTINSRDQMTYTIKIFKTLTLYGRQFGSLRSLSSKHSAYVMASWAEEDGSINESANQRPGKVLYYVLHKLNTRTIF